MCKRLNVTWLLHSSPIHCLVACLVHCPHHAILYYNVPAVPGFAYMQIEKNVEREASGEKSSLSLSGFTKAAQNLLFLVPARVTRAMLLRPTGPMASSASSAGSLESFPAGQQHLTTVILQPQMQPVRVLYSWTDAGSHVWQGYRLKSASHTAAADGPGHPSPLPKQ